MSGQSYFIKTQNDRGHSNCRRENDDLYYLEYYRSNIPVSQDDRDRSSWAETSYDQQQRRSHSSVNQRYDTDRLSYTRENDDSNHLQHSRSNIPVSQDDRDRSSWAETSYDQQQRRSHSSVNQRYDRDRLSYTRENDNSNHLQHSRSNIPVSQDDRDRSSWAETSYDQQQRRSHSSVNQRYDRDRLSYTRENDNSNHLQHSRSNIPVSQDDRDRSSWAETSYDQQQRKSHSSVNQRYDRDRLSYTRENDNSTHLRHSRSNIPVSQDDRDRSSWAETSYDQQQCRSHSSESQNDRGRQRYRTRHPSSFRSLGRNYSNKTFHKQPHISQSGRTVNPVEEYGEITDRLHNRAPALSRLPCQLEKEDANTIYPKKTKDLPENTGQVLQQSSSISMQLGEEDTITSNAQIDQLNKNKESSKRSHSKEESELLGSSGKKKRAVKQNTEHGNEYQRTVQILLRYRGLQTPGFKLGAEVSGVGDFDDIVYITSKNSCRFFQVKHSEQAEIPLSNIFKTPGSTNTQSVKGRKIRPKFELLKYFESFCEIKKNNRFWDLVVEELSILTSQKLQNKRIDQKYKEYLEKDSNFQNDNLLYLQGENAEKYYLKIKEFKNNREFMNCMHEKYVELFPKKEEMENETINEYLEKVRYIVGYPCVGDLKLIVSKQIFHDDIDISDVLMSKVISFESEHLSNRGREESAEFLTNEKWHEEIERIKSSIKKSKESRITHYETQTYLDKYYELEFDNDDMFKDLTTFLNHTKESILYISGVINEDFVAVNIVQELNRIIHRDNQEASSQNMALKVGFSIEKFVSQELNILVVKCESVGFSKELATKLKLGLTNPGQKIILISASKNETNKYSESYFISIIKELSNESYLEKRYLFDFNHLSQTSKKQILAKKAEFQGDKIMFGSLFSNDMNFANNVIDEAILSKITLKEEIIKLLDENSFESPGYNEDYYVTRELYQNRVSFEAVRGSLRENLILITYLQGMKYDDMLNILTENSIEEKYIQKWSKKAWNEKKLFRNNGIILSESNDQIFKEITKTNITNHWILLHKTKLFHIDSRYSVGESIPLQMAPPTFKEEFEFSNPQSLEEIVILVGDSGVGKSTVMTSIARSIRERFKDIKNRYVMWILKVNLRTFYNKKIVKQIGNPTKKDTAVRFIVEMASFTDSSNFLARKIIEEGLTTFQDHFHMVLLLDGFNEISISYRNKTCSLIKTLNSECNVKQIFITTQIQEKAKLESEFNVPAYFLSNLDLEKQIKLMVDYWKTKYKTNPAMVHDIDQLYMDAKNVLNKWNHSISDKDGKSFTEVSLNVIMLADVFVIDRKMNENIDLCSLYDTFISKKFSIFNEETSRQKKLSSELEQAKEKIFQYSIREILQELAVRIIFMTNNYSYEIQTLPKMNVFERFKTVVEDPQQKGVLDTILSKIGLLSITEEIDFSHNSFAQFFFSEYLFDNLNENSIQVFFVKYVLSKDNLNLCRKFLNNLLQKQNKYYSEAKKNLNDQINKRTLRAISSLAEEELDSIIMLLVSLLGKHYASFIEKWTINELPFLKENEDSVNRVREWLKESFKLPVKLRKIILFKKTHSLADDESKQKIMLEYLSQRQFV